jgi:hypothetical protein
MNSISQLANARPVHPSLPSTTQRLIALWQREVWKKTMFSIPDLGGMWSVTMKIAAEYERWGCWQDALAEYERAVAMVDIKGCIKYETTVKVNLFYVLKGQGYLMY